MDLERYKLNVYSGGGFFKSHVDSPSGNEMIGTLVLCLPSPHKGGELFVSHDGLEHVFDFSNHSGDKNKIQWAAFTVTAFTKSNQFSKVIESQHYFTKLCVS